MSAGLVIGASGGIGAACARLLAGSVDRLILSGRDDVRLAEIVPGSVEVVADIATAKGRDSIMAAVTNHLPLRWVVFASGMPLRGALAELDPRDIETTFLTNLVGPTLLLRTLSNIAWTPKASVVIIGSTSANRALVNRSVYAASKAGLEHLAYSVAAEWAPRSIRVNIVAPGVIATPFLGKDSSRLDAWVADKVPTGRLGAPDEVAQLVRYLILDAPDYLVGSRLVIDGGLETLA